MADQGEQRIRATNRPTIVAAPELRTEVLDALPEGMPLFEHAIKRRSASFAQVAEAYFFRQEKFNGDARLRPSYEHYFTPLTEAFEHAYGQITHSFYCTNVAAAAALTVHNELCVVLPAIDPKHVAIADILLECDRLNIESSRVLAARGKKERATDLRTTKILIYAVTVRLLSLLDSGITPPRALTALHWREIKNARDFYLRAAARYAKLDYIRGMSFGILLAVVIAVLAFFSMRYLMDLEIPGKMLAASLMAGGLGAVVSVMSRMTFGELTLDHEAGSTILVILGIFRPLIGMILGTAMWVLSASGVLAIGPTDPTGNKMQFFYILVAFLAGFTERWAQDMLGRAAGQIGGRGKSSAGGKTETNRPNEVNVK